MGGRRDGRAESELKRSIAREGSNARKGRTRRRLNERAMGGREGGRERDRGDGRGCVRERRKGAQGGRDGN